MSEGSLLPLRFLLVLFAGFVNREQANVDGCLEPRDSGGLPRFWFFLKQRSSWVWFLAMAAKALAAGPRGRWPRPGCRLQSAATIRPVQTEARRTA
jgi:hypothetical protein